MAYIDYRHRIEFGYEEYAAIDRHCSEKKIPWFASCWDIESVDLMDAFDWLKQAEPCSIHAVVTDPPYGLLEYTPKQLEKMKNGRGGVWRGTLFDRRIYDCGQRSGCAVFD